MVFSLRDRIAVLIAIALGLGFAHLSILGGYGWLVAAVPYIFVFVPCLVIFVADQKILFVWQASIVAYAVYIAATYWGLPWNIPAFVLDVLVLGDRFGVVTMPVPVILYLHRRGAL